jgi:hypothetical protein
MKKKLAIVTIHKGNLKNLIKTIKSIDSQTEFPDLHLVIINHLGFNHSQIFKRRNRKIIISKDRSLWHAMNIGLKYTFDFNLLFLNSGDEFYSNHSISWIKRNICGIKCLIFKTVLKKKKMIFFPESNFFLNNNYSPHPSFIRPPIIKKLYFQEEPKTFADGIWMQKNRDLYNFRKKDKIISKFYLDGGASTYPTFTTIKWQFTFKFIEGMKELIKFVLLKIFGDKYYELIYFQKFKKK